MAAADYYPTHVDYDLSDRCHLTTCPVDALLVELGEARAEIARLRALLRCVEDLLAKARGPPGVVSQRGHHPEDCSE